jgi:hypothetical protein
MDKIMSVGQMVEYSADVYSRLNGLIGVIKDFHYVNGSYEYDVDFHTGDYGRIAGCHLELVDEVGNLQVIEFFSGFVPKKLTSSELAELRREEQLRLQQSK